MQISFSPRRQDKPLTLEKQGDALTINGELFDFSPLPDGATLPREAVTCDWLASDVARIAGEIHLSLILPHGRQAPKETLFPGVLAVATDGLIAIPPHSSLAPDEEATT